MSQLEVVKVSKTWEDDHRTALKDVSFKVEDGQFLCLMGPSGCGKSTLLRIMAGLEPASSGTVLNQPPRVGFVFQNFGLMPWLTVAENVSYGLKMAGVNRALAKKMTMHQIHEMGLSGLAKKHPKELSGGQKQRVGIARALAIDPDILLLDEPFSSLDTFTAEELRAELLSIWHRTGKTIVMVTHLPAEAAELADRIIVFSSQPGRVIKDIPNRLERPRHLRSEKFFALEDELEGLIRPRI